MSKESSIRLTHYRKLYMSVRYKTVFFPFDIRELVEALPQNGYVVRDELLTPFPFGASVHVSGPIAHKGDIDLSINTDRGYVGIDAIDTQALTNEMNAIEDMLLNRLGFDSQRSALFYELLAEATVRTGRNPIEVLGSTLVEEALFKQLGRVIGEPSTSFSLRLVPTEGEPNQADWHDIKIEPFVPSATTHYLISVVFRRAERSKVIDFAGKLDAMLGDILSQLEAE